MAQNLYCSWIKGFLTLYTTPLEEPFTLIEGGWYIFNFAGSWFLSHNSTFNILHKCHFARKHGLWLYNTWKNETVDNCAKHPGQELQMTFSHKILPYTLVMKIMSYRQIPSRTGNMTMEYVQNIQISFFWLAWDLKTHTLLNTIYSNC